MPSGGKVKFIVYLDSEGSSSPSGEKFNNSTKGELDSSSASTKANLAVNSSAPLTDNEIFRAQRAVETSLGAKTGGKDADYTAKHGVYLGAYQINPKVWQKAIKEKFGWEINDWYSDDPDSESADVYKLRQDMIAKQVMLPDSKRQIKSKGLYENTLLGQFLPKGSIEIASQLGVSNVENFLNTGKDTTGNKDQTVKYIVKGMNAINKPVPQEFFDKLEELDPGINNRLKGYGLVTSGRGTKK